MIATDPTIQSLIQAVEAADSPAKLVGAVRALAQARSTAAIPTLIRALGFNNPGAALAAVSGLVALGEEAVPDLLAQIDGYNYGARAYSLRALAAIADPRALDVLIKAAEADFAPSVRRAAIKGLGQLRWQQLEPTERESAQSQALKTLLLVAQDADWANRYAAIVGLQSWITSADLVNRSSAIDQLDQLAQTDPDGAVRARATLAKQHLA
ncbi:HEAT repeat domain-containing protein [Leptolyngbya sp. FACHB-17]|uniref:HEAT repeat domain-containing protein n=1 Tax=unclassified Leptolyngbya TaxID=2650499 RepID=UPI00168181E4|nr:HEAT repeat domain-containing protein [Leptolyngbya sp. FACHB-17]MBD2081907.1 HEAT repeat domain-containing protein [Leptolyngbya sp. FACHB-17]